MPRHVPEANPTDRYRVPDWHKDPAGEIVAARDAEFWQRRGGGRVECTLCYRRCEMAAGEAGWCTYRRNDRGRVTLSDHGVLSGICRTQNGYVTSPFFTHKPGMPGISVGLTYCTASCSFCIAGNISWRPERIPWAWGERQPGRGFFHGMRAMVHPAGIVTTARNIGVQSIEFNSNEPLLSWEYTYDTARLAAQAGIECTLLTNGFSTPEAVRKLAPFISAVYVGIKGNADPAFYERYMKAPGAVPAVYESLRAWREGGTHVIVGDVIAPEHMQPETDLIEAQKRHFDWIAENLGPHTVVTLIRMRRPHSSHTGAQGAHEKDEGGPMLPPDAPPEAFERFDQRVLESVERAHAAGLSYATNTTTRVVCHSCGGTLLNYHTPRIHCEECVMFNHHCPFWYHDQHVTDQRCDHCGASVPIIAMPTDQLQQVKRHVLESTRGTQDLDRQALDMKSRFRLAHIHALWEGDEEAEE